MESGLMLDSSKGHVVIETDDKWNIELLHVEFNGKLKMGDATQETSDYIVERMGLCPVSCNLKNIDNSKTTIAFE